MLRVQEVENKKDVFIFGEVEIGSCFLFKGNLYIKLIREDFSVEEEIPGDPKESTELVVETFCLSTPNDVNDQEFEYTTKVIPVDATISYSLKTN